MGQREIGRWGHYGDNDTIGLEGAFDMNPTSDRSVCRYDRKRGLLCLNGYFETGNDVWFDVGTTQRHLNSKLRYIVRARRDKSMCICQNGTKRRRGKDKSTNPLIRFANVQYYALCERPEPEKVQEMVDVIKDTIGNECYCQG